MGRKGQSMLGGNHARDPDFALISGGPVEDGVEQKQQKISTLVFVFFPVTSPGVLPTADVMTIERMSD
jgi:hypothetical protein